MTTAHNNGDASYLVNFSGTVVWDGSIDVEPFLMLYNPDQTAWVAVVVTAQPSPNQLTVAGSTDISNASAFGIIAQPAHIAAGEPFALGTTPMT